MFPRQPYKSSVDKPWHEVKNLVATQKFDGASFYVPIDSQGNLRFFSRALNVAGTYPERTSQLPHLTTKKLPQFAGNVYNVELIHTGHSKENRESHAKVSGILNSKTEKSIATQKETGPVRAVLIDVVNPKFATYKEKLLHMKQVQDAFGNPDILFVAHPHIGKAETVKLIDKTRNEGREGIIVTSLTEPESNNPRVKVVHNTYYNLRVKGLVEEVDLLGRPKGSLGAAELEDATDRSVGKVGTGFSKEEREYFWQHPEEIIGKVIQVKTKGLVKHEGAIRAGVWNGFADGQVDKVEFK